MSMRRFWLGLKLVEKNRMEPGRENNEMACARHLVQSVESQDAFQFVIVLSTGRNRFEEFIIHHMPLRGHKLGGEVPDKTDGAGVLGTETQELSEPCLGFELGDAFAVLQSWVQDEGRRTPHSRPGYHLAVEGETTESFDRSSP